MMAPKSGEIAVAWLTDTGPNTDLSVASPRRFEPGT